MRAAQRSVLCGAFRNVDRIGLATGDPGPAGESNDSGITKAMLTWSTPTSGVMTTVGDFSDVSGTFTHITFWDADVFVDSRPRAITLGTPTDLSVAVEFRVTG